MDNLLLSFRLAKSTTTTIASHDSCQQVQGRKNQIHTHQAGSAQSFQAMPWAPAQLSASLQAQPVGPRVPLGPRLCACWLPAPACTPPSTLISPDDSFFLCSLHASVLRGVCSPLTHEVSHPSVGNNTWKRSQRSLQGV